MPSGFYYDRAKTVDKVNFRNRLYVVKPEIPEFVFSGVVCSCGLNREFFGSRKEFKEHAKICGK